MVGPVGGAAVHSYGEHAPDMPDSVGLGESGDQVAVVQDLLAATGDDLGSEADSSVYGAQTEQAVLSAQIQAGLDPTGIVDEATLDLLVSNAEAAWAFTPRDDAQVATEPEVAEDVGDIAAGAAGVHEPSTTERLEALYGAGVLNFDDAGPAAQAAGVSPPTSGVAAPGEASFEGDGIPPELHAAFDKAKASKWGRMKNRCLQFAGTLVDAAGGTKTADKPVTYPHKAYGPAIKDFRGRHINELGEAVDKGLLKPGMLIHVKIHYDRDTPYHWNAGREKKNRYDDAHHWITYMGKDAAGVPRFADSRGREQTAEKVYQTMKDWPNSKRWGDRKYGYIPRVTAFYDPFHDRRGAAEKP